MGAYFSVIFSEYNLEGEETIKYYYAGEYLTLKGKWTDVTYKFTGSDMQLGLDIEDATVSIEFTMNTFIAQNEPAMRGIQGTIGLAPMIDQTWNEKYSFLYQVS